MRISDWSSDVCSSDLADAVGARSLLRPDETLRRRPAGAAIFDRPGGRDPALFVKDLVPGEEILLGQFFALILLAAEFRGIIFGDELANFLLEGQILGAEFHVHHESPIGHWRPYNGRSPLRSEEHTSELQSLMRLSYAVFCLKKKTE